MSSSNDLIKFMTQELVRYIDTPREERLRKPRESLLTHWFGMLPLSLKMLIKNKE